MLEPYDEREHLRDCPAFYSGDNCECDRIMASEIAVDNLWENEIDYWLEVSR